MNGSPSHYSTFYASHRRPRPTLTSKPVQFHIAQPVLDQYRHIQLYPPTNKRIRHVSNTHPSQSQNQQTTRSLSTKHYKQNIKQHYSIKEERKQSIKDEWKQNMTEKKNQQKDQQIQQRKEEYKPRKEEWMQSIDRYMLSKERFLERQGQQYNRFELLRLDRVNRCRKKKKVVQGSLPSSILSHQPFQQNFSFDVMVQPFRKTSKTHIRRLTDTSNIGMETSTRLMETSTRLAETSVRETDKQVILIGTSARIMDQSAEFMGTRKGGELRVKTEGQNKVLKSFICNYFKKKYSLPDKKQSFKHKLRKTQTRRRHFTSYCYTEGQ